MRIILTAIPLALLLAQPALAQTSSSPPPAGKRCISTFNLGNPVALSDGRVVFHGEPRKAQSYVAVFKGRCPGVRLDSRFVLVREMGGGQVCEGDRMRAFEPGDIIPGPICIIDHFEPYTEPPRKGR